MPTITITPSNTGTTSGPLGTVDVNSLPGTFLVQKSDGSINSAPTVQVCSGSADAVLFGSPFNVAIFTSTGPDAATLAVPGAGDIGKVLMLVNTNTTQNVVTTTANKIVNGTATPGDTLTAPAHAGAVAVLVASSGFWNLQVSGTGTQGTVGGIRTWPVAIVARVVAAIRPQGHGHGQWVLLGDRLPTVPYWTIPPRYCCSARKGSRRGPKATAMSSSSPTHN